MQWLSWAYIHVRAQKTQCHGISYMYSILNAKDGDFTIHNGKKVMYKSSKFLICILEFGRIALGWPSWPLILGVLFTLVPHQRSTRDLKITKLLPTHVNMCHYTSIVMACIEEMFQMHKWKAFRANHLELLMQSEEVLKNWIAIINRGLTYWIHRVGYFNPQGKNLEEQKWPLTYTFIPL